MKLMNDLEPKFAASGVNPGDSSGCIRSQLNILLLGLIILSATVAISLWRQAHYSSLDLQAIKQQKAYMQQVVNQERPVME